MQKEEPDKRLALAISHVRADVEAGASLADALQKQPHAFDALYTHMVAAGEAGGILDTILQRLATYIEKQAKLKSQVRSAMIYPSAVLSVAAMAVVRHSVESHSDIHDAVRRPQRDNAVAHAHRHLGEQGAHRRHAVL